MKLNPKQQRFCEEYLIDLNATQAAIRAGYSKKTATVQASKLLTKLHIQEYVNKLRSRIQDDTDVTIQGLVKFINEVMQEAREDGDRANALKGADMLMKSFGGYNATEQSNDTTHTLIFETLPKHAAR